MTFVPAGTLEEVLKTSVFFYISGHGFGHAARQIEVINALGASRPGVDIVVRTSAPRWLFDRTVRVPFTFLPVYRTNLIDFIPLFKCFT